MSENILSTDPTNVQVHNKLSGFGRRFLAYVVDLEVIWVLNVTILTMLGDNYLEALFNRDLERETLGIWSTLLPLVIAALYFIIFTAYYQGSTLGKRIMAIRVVSQEGGEVTLPVSIVRYLGSLLSGFVLGLGYLWVMWDKKKEAWHDKIAKTFVVETGAKPKTALGIILTLILVSLYLAIIIGASIEAVNSIEKGMEMQSQRTEISEDAKVHYDKAMELFKTLGTLSDKEAMKPVADETITEMKIAVELEPTNPVLWSSLYNAYTWPNNLEKTGQEGLEAIQKAFELDSDNIRYSNDLGQEYVNLEMYEEAVLQLQKSLRIDSESGNAHFSMGMAYGNLRVYDTAIDHFEKAISIYESDNDDGSYDEKILQARQNIAVMSNNK